MKPEGVLGFDHRGPDWARYEKSYDPNRKATPAEGTRVVAFTKLIHQADDAAFARDIGAVLDLDNYLRFLAATAFVANTDSLFTGGHNFCPYLHPTTHKLHVIPWDLDRAFANFPIFGSARRQTEPMLDNLDANGDDRLSRAEWRATAKRVVEVSPRGADGKTDLKGLTAGLEKMLPPPPPGTPKGGFNLAGFLAGGILARADADKDGRVTPAEVLAAADAAFDRFDRADAGALDETAFAALLTDVFPAPKFGPPPPPKRDP